MSNDKREHLLETLRMLGELALGCLIYAVSVDIFYTPAKLLGGGVTGFAQILNYEFGVPVSVMILAINIPLFIAALIFVDREFTLFSFIGMLMLSGAMQLFSGLSIAFSSSLTAVVVGGVINGLGLGLIYRSGASVGGTDIISKIIQKYFSGNMAYTGLAFNVVVVGTSALIYGLDQAVLTICAMYIGAQVDTWVIDGVDHRRAISIITTKPYELAERIDTEIHRGATVLHGTGAYTKSEHDMIYCVISKRQLAKLKRVIKSVDPDAFFTITAVTGVYGKGSDFFSIEKNIK